MIVNRLLIKFIEDEISGEEMEQLLQYLREGHEEELQYAIDNAFKNRDFSHLAANSRPDVVLRKILTAASNDQALVNAKKSFINLSVSSAAFRVAAAFLVILFGWIAYSLLKPASYTGKLRKHPFGVEAANFTRFIILPDSSTVVLKANSTLTYPAFFTGSKREVVLSGEAYFDIRHDEKRPFSIRTGEVLTTVLGTAFNIQAIPGTGEVTVSVARGKVRVSNQKSIIAVLQPDQQVVYSTSTAHSLQKQVNSNKIITDWTTEDMVFETVSMGAIAEALSKRYGVDIAISNPGLMECPVKITFSGTEALTDVLTALCTVTGARFRKEDNGQIFIDGEGCQ